MPTKKKLPTLKTSKQLQQECQSYLKSTFSEIQHQHQQCIADIQSAIKTNRQLIKDSKLALRASAEKRAATEAKLAKKKTQTALNALAKTQDAVKAIIRDEKIATQALGKLQQQLVEVKAYKAKAKAREAALKTFDKTYQADTVVSGEITNTKALIESTLHIGDKAPDFTAVLADNKGISLSQYKGKQVVLYFYPRDNTPGCTIEANDFTASNGAFAAKNAVIIGVSRDSLTSHQKFIDKFSIPYTLLADTDETICQAYGVIKNKNMYGKKVRGIERSTFLIDAQGNIKHIWRKVKVEEHVEAVLSALD